MKIKHLFLGIGVMVFASCAVDKTKKLDVDKELTYCDMQIHRALSELEKDGEPDYTMEPRNFGWGADLELQKGDSGRMDGWILAGNFVV